MANGRKNLEKSWENRKKTARDRAMDTIRQMLEKEESVNFSSVSKCSGISKSFLYDDVETRKLIEAIRKQEVDNEMNRRVRYEKTSHSKDVIIEAKDKRIAKLETEVRQLRSEINTLRAMIYETS